MRWKNGLGLTAEIAIEPANAIFPQDDFLWRLSSAKVQAQNNFSQFPGYDRILMVIQGHGLLLNQAVLVPLVPYSFRGEELINCDLIDGEVVDLGVIYKRDQVRVEVSSCEWSANRLRREIPLHGELNFLFCVQGSFLIQDQIVEVFDTVEIQGPTVVQVDFFAQKSAKICLFAITFAKKSEK